MSKAATHRKPPSPKPQRRVFKSRVTVEEAEGNIRSLVKTLDELPGRKIALTSNGGVVAYLSSASQSEAKESKEVKERRAAAWKSIIGSLEIVGDLDAHPTPSEQSEAEIMAAWNRLNG